MNTTNTKNRPELQLMADDCLGVYIPQRMAQGLPFPLWQGITQDDWDCLNAGPTQDNEWYWDCWDSVLNNAVLRDGDGNEYTLWQDGACWAVPIGMEWDDETETFAWPVEDEYWQVMAD